ncbi:helix-turn-helix transcriptional regulator [Providencia rettgeri]|uniref:Helix-turn-helix transcriptional regulator n=2 Tax=Providencia rettgeri TaxID=587 RepID=A0AAJ4NK66_PRORE|nr:MULTISPECIES: helix-turn-helix transcriptional regulator [Providencia]QWQ18019.2 helix-turn-helix transcriptional regulator [Providencia rettgeri]QWQ21853.2 helix-turn-helix transcriptional regulator [Providencia rettgeri]QWQ25692.2 helix-turn-helix transcriptional regulator [Providencia rettgeri]
MGKESIAKMLGIKIRKQRENHKISIERMASLIGVTEEEMNRFETGESCIDVDSLFQFAYLFNVDPTSFLYGVVNINGGTYSSLHWL